MRRIRRENTSVEMKLRRAVWRAGLRYRTHPRIEGTKPDMIFSRRKVAIFVDGCFWHGCPVHYVAPVNNAAFWQKRLVSNQGRDMRDTLRLQAAGWAVLRLWECEVNRELDRVVEQVRNAVTYGILSL
jgi:DNA mismatch endonuclease (patch repair protein)